MKQRNDVNNNDLFSIVRYYAKVHILDNKEIKNTANLYWWVFSTQIPKITDPTIPPTIKSAPNRLESESSNPNYDETYPTIVPKVLNVPFIWPKTNINTKKLTSFNAPNIYSLNT